MIVKKHMKTDAAFSFKHYKSLLAHGDVPNFPLFLLWIM